MYKCFMKYKCLLLVILLKILYVLVHPTVIGTLTMIGETTNSYPAFSNVVIAIGWFTYIIISVPMSVGCTLCTRPKEYLASAANIILEFINHTCILL